MSAPVSEWSALGQAAHSGVCVRLLAEHLPRFMSALYVKTRKLSLPDRELGDQAAWLDSIMTLDGSY